MSERMPSVERIKNDLLDLRKNGCAKHIGMSTDLLRAMGCQSASIEKKISCVITLVQMLVYEPDQAEELLAALGLLKGYETIAELGKRRRLYYKNAYPDGKSKRPESFLHKRENVVIEHLAKRIAATPDLPAILAKAPEEPKYPVPRYYEKHLGHIPALGPFALYIDSERPLAAGQSEFDYRAEAIPFCYREEELSRLDSFCADERKVLWWAIVGGGGAGKSRLAHRYMQTRASSEWKILFLRGEFFAQVGGGGKYHKFDEWSYPKNLLLVVDSVQRYTAAVAEWIESVTAKKSEGSKLRILLLDRCGEDGQWCIDFKDRPAVLYSRYALPHELKPLSDTELAGFARAYLADKKAAYTDEDIDRLVGLLESYDQERRILFFIFLIELFCEPDIYEQTAQKFDLLGYIVDREIRTIKERFAGREKAFRAYMKLLIYATMVGGVSVTAPPAWLDGKCRLIYDEFSDAHAAHRAMAARDGFLLPFTPDLVGELLVLRDLSKFFPLETDREELARHIWSHPIEYSKLFVNICADYIVPQTIGLREKFNVIVNYPFKKDVEGEWQQEFRGRSFIFYISRYRGLWLKHSRRERTAKFDNLSRYFQKIQDEADVVRILILCEVCLRGGKAFAPLIRAIDKSIEENAEAENIELTTIEALMQMPAKDALNWGDSLQSLALRSNNPIASEMFSAYLPIYIKMLSPEKRRVHVEMMNELREFFTKRKKSAGELVACDQVIELLRE